MNEWMNDYIDGFFHQTDDDFNFRFYLYTPGKKALFIIIVIITIHGMATTTQCRIIFATLLLHVDEGFMNTKNAHGVPLHSVITGSRYNTFEDDEC